MGNIIYKPHCGKCGAIINQEVTYSKFMLRDNYLYGGDLIDISPCRCTCCGEVFETIEIPMPKEER